MDEHERSETLRLLPSIDALLHTETAAKLLPEVGAKHLTVLVRAVINSLRQELSNEGNENKSYSRENLLEAAERHLESARRDEQNVGLRQVINATGVIIHTNLGRAPLSENAIKALIENASRYCNLEYNLQTGKRGKRIDCQ